ncbi:hypothetical protein BDV36DRAFT_83237 [Aspergillus pseudocaelatus]|uniref:Uncharacterized protein n=1 Tax=Aspergillus pseudocaelatus TaxID=1825620 RepID=A0ABQ6W2Y7_9EURO|nr:hypothetical protein BDV36DRAFT_83237 [Aspergillus pseudocaelatus]
MYCNGTLYRGRGNFHLPSIRILSPRPRDSVKVRFRETAESPSVHVGHNSSQVQLTAPVSCILVYATNYTLHYHYLCCCSLITTALSVHHEVAVCETPGN